MEELEVEREDGVVMKRPRSDSVQSPAERASRVQM